MDQDLQPIRSVAGDFERGAPKNEPGQLLMVEMDKLRVDYGYQRAITGPSARNIIKIVKDFDWLRFTPIIGYELENGYIGVIDGQHRATAAYMSGVKVVPVYVHKAPREAAAAAFAAINGNVTQVSNVDVYVAKLMAGDPEAVELDTICQAADVKIVRRAGPYAVGETKSVNVLLRAKRSYGNALITTILQCITQTGNGNAGMLSGAVINGIGKAIQNKEWLTSDPMVLFDILDGVSMASLFDAARQETLRTGNPPQFIITRMLNEHIKSMQEKAS